VMEHKCRMEQGSREATECRSGRVHSAGVRHVVDKDVCL